MGSGDSPPDDGGSPEDDHHSVRHRAHTVLSLVRSILPHDYHHHHHSTSHVSPHHHHHSIIHKLRMCIHNPKHTHDDRHEQQHEEVDCPISPWN
eukprot:gene22941-29124_t